MPRLVSPAVARLFDIGYLHDIDYHFACFVHRLDPHAHDDLLLAASLVSHAVLLGDVCLDLSALAGDALPTGSSEKEPVVCPSLDRWRTHLMASHVVGVPGQKRPLILDAHHRLYYHRYWQYEQTVASGLLRRASIRQNGFNPLRLMELLNRFFNAWQANPGDRQFLAALTTVFRGLCIISGGPGTGKTTAIAKIIALVAALNPKRDTRALLAAPTGKAAARLAESLAESSLFQNDPPGESKRLRMETTTIHRMLKVRSGSPYFQHDDGNPLSADLVVVDEASMVDLALMAKLVSAVPTDARLVLVGDKDQLASVEAGSVLGDICGSGAHGPVPGDISAYALLLAGGSDDLNMPDLGGPARIENCMVLFEKNFRFPEKSAIARAGSHIRKGDSAAMMDLLSHPPDSTIEWLAFAEPASAMAHLRTLVLSGYGAYLEADDIGQALELFNRFRILCAVNKGPLGVKTINRFVFSTLLASGRIDAAGPDVWYTGRPVMITRNDYRLGLYNGDVGIAFPESGKATGDLFVHFAGTDGEPRCFSPYRLSAHETAFATTVHKSQGSEFDQVAMILPDRDGPLLTRELLYTGLTRARKRLTLYGAPGIIERAVSRRIHRASGLRDALGWQAI